MGKALKHFIAEFQHKIPQHINPAADYEKVSARLKQHHINLESKSLQKLRGYVLMKEKPSKKTLDRLALFAGFQNWKDLQTAIHGGGDGQLNYEEEDKKD
ncbi:hypothetical protein [Prevotella falsenii]|uniref:hypothetical protein n=1 Tax=Prevotella falsenii TaxID=515414 RepID=UPI0004689BA0|nr:hypothetical protein [Prevotella falsenii]